MSIWGEYHKWYKSWKFEFQVWEKEGTMTKMSATQALKKLFFFKWYLVLDMFSITVSANSNGCKGQGGRAN